MRKSNFIILNILMLLAPLFSNAAENYLSHLLTKSSYKLKGCGLHYLNQKNRYKITFLNYYQLLRTQQKKLTQLFPLTLNEMEELNLKIATVVSKTLINDGFKVGTILKIKSTAEVSGQKVSTLDFYVPILEAPANSKMDKVLKRLQKTNPNLKFHYIVDSMGRANGAYSDYRSVIYLNPDHIYLDHGDFTNTFLHEITHSHRYKLAEQGQTSLLNASISSTDNQAVTSVPGYTTYMSFQELATFTKDYHQLKKQVPNINVISSEVTTGAKQLTTADVVEMKRTRAITIARNIQQIVLSQQEYFQTIYNSLITNNPLTKFTVNSIEYKNAKANLNQLFTLQSDPLSANHWMVKFPYHINGTRVGDFQMWIPEFKLSSEKVADPDTNSFGLISQKIYPSELSKEDLQNLMNHIKTQLKQIKQEATSYEDSLDF
jgi:hypothetical protein